MKTAFIRSILLLIAAILPTIAIPAAERSTIEFESMDGLSVTADVYASETPASPVVLLFHQANSSRGEYRDIAPRLAAEGYTAIAVDLRAGAAFNNVENETAMAAAEARKKTRYSDAYQDMEAALRHAVTTYPNRPVVVLGSSYSASLALILAAQHPEHVDVVLAFSPGEYFGDRNAHFVRGFAGRVSVPVFLTGARSEMAQIQELFEAVPARTKTLYRPLVAGQHGARVLSVRQPGSEGYWFAAKDFLLDLELGKAQRNVTASAGERAE